MKTKKALIKDIAYWLDLMGIAKYSFTGLNVHINNDLDITAISRTRITFKNKYGEIYDVNMSSREVTKEILQMIIDGIMRKYS